MSKLAIVFYPSVCTVHPGTATASSEDAFCFQAALRFPGVATEALGLRPHSGAATRAAEDRPFLHFDPQVPRQMRLRRSSAQMAHDPYTLVVAPDSGGGAAGELYLDEGDGYAYKEGAYHLRRFAQAQHAEKGPLVQCHNSACTAAFSQVTLARRSVSSEERPSCS